jgi:hypothetical protein
VTQLSHCLRNIICFITYQVHTILYAGTTQCLVIQATECQVLSSRAKQCWFETVQAQASKPYTSLCASSSNAADLKLCTSRSPRCAEHRHTSRLSVTLPETDTCE